MLKKLIFALILAAVGYAVMQRVRERSGDDPFGGNGFAPSSATRETVNA